MKISIITWDASFRESFHTVKFFLDQDFNKNEYEFIWVDYYKNQNQELKKLIGQNNNFRILNLGNPKTDQWHLGKCINAGVKASTGDILIIPDGDVIVYPNLLSLIAKELDCHDNSVVYCRRWDEPEKKHNDIKSYNLDYLEEVCKLRNATNYGGLLATKRNIFNKVNGYEEHEIFAGPGSNGLEQYIRFRNAGCFIKWHDQKIYHPYHSFTGSSDKKLEILIELKNKYPWLNPYRGVKQSWFLRRSELTLKSKAGLYSQEIVDSTPDILKKNKKSESKTWLKKLFP